MVAYGPVFFADVSYYQPLYTSAYSAVRDVIAFRADSGYGTDGDVVQNWSRIEADLDDHSLACALVYVVYIPGANADIMSRLKGVFGNVPDDRLAWMVDMESGKGFAGPGDHSTGGNQLANMLAAWCGSTDKVIGYANGGDWANSWPHPPSWMPKSKRIIAQYGGTKPDGYFAWQYTNGQWQNSYGYPLSSPPFGACDHNAYLGTGGLVGMLTTLGIGEDVALTPAEIDAVGDNAAKKVMAFLLEDYGVPGVGKIPFNDHVQFARRDALKAANGVAAVTVVDDKVDALGSQVEQLLAKPAPTAAEIAAAVVAALPANPGGGATPAEVEAAVREVLTGATITGAP